MLGLLELGDELLGQLGADFGVPPFGLELQLFQAIVLFAHLRLEVVPPAFHQPVARVKQAPGGSALGIRLNHARHRGWDLLQALGNPLGLQENGGGGSHQGPMCLNSRHHVRPEPR